MKLMKQMCHVFVSCKTIFMFFFFFWLESIGFGHCLSNFPITSFIYFFFFLAFSILYFFEFSVLTHILLLLVGHVSSHCFHKWPLIYIYIIYIHQMELVEVCWSEYNFFSFCVPLCVYGDIFLSSLLYCTLTLLTC